jgi:hypothetical protein
MFHYPNLDNEDAIGSFSDGLIHHDNDLEIGSDLSDQVFPYVFQTPLSRPQCCTSIPPIV